MFREKDGVQVVEEREREIKQDLDPTPDKTSDTLGTRQTEPTELLASQQAGVSGVVNSTERQPRTTLISTMGDHAGPKHPTEATGGIVREPDVKKKPTPPSRKGMRPANAWPKGVSGNPAGRPRSPNSFAERVRERVDPDLVIDLAMRIAEDESLSPTERLRELWPLVQQGWVKPPSGLAINVTNATGEVDFGHLTDEQIEHELHRLEVLALPAADPEPT